ncbi:MAG: hypothetical protein E6525_26015 [Klebsiella grimontii]|nr:hypothetical protein [Klebsiella grimontii]
MATVQYPPFLPLPQRADQNMTQDTAWQTTLDQAERFKSWLRSPTYCDRGRNWFQMPIDLGDTQGVQLQTLHFVSMPVQTSKNGNIVTWTATVISNGIEDITEDYDDWIVEAQPGYGYWLDYLITEVMPRAD